MNFKNDNKSFIKDSKYSYLRINSFPMSGNSRIFIFHKIINVLNLSVLILLFTFSFLSLNGQRKWTNFYSLMIDLRTINNNLIDFISITEELYINEIDKLDNFKKTTSKDLIYVSENIKQKEIKKISQYFLNFKRGIQEGIYQKGNL